jgi:hypothetical protein
MQNKQSCNIPCPSFEEHDTLCVSLSLLRSRYDCQYPPHQVEGEGLYTLLTKYLVSGIRVEFQVAGWSNINKGNFNCFSFDIFIARCVLGEVKNE